MPWAMEGGANDGEVDLAVLRCLRSQDERGGAEAQRGMDQAGPRCVPPCLSQGRQPWCSLTHAFLTGLLALGEEGDARVDNQRAAAQQRLLEVPPVRGADAFPASVAIVLADTWRAPVCRPEYRWRCEDALAVVSCESSGDPLAYNAGSIGLFQVHYPSHYDKVSSAEELYDPTVNIAVAYRIWQDSAWLPWACRKLP